jgi:osmoprotectant transport system permease protein
MLELRMLQPVNRIALLGGVLGLIGGLLPWLIFKANRLLPGQNLWWWSLGLEHALVLVVFGAVIWFSRQKERGVWLAVLGNLALTLLLVLLGLEARVLAENPLSRVAPSAGAWLALASAALVIYGARLEVRAWWVNLAFVFAVLWIAVGGLNALSVLREYASSSSEFWNELSRHALLALSALLIAGVLGLTLGVAASRSPRGSSLVLGLVSALQTVPSIALFALLIPLFSALVRGAPWLESLGVRGIGVAPALTALALYGLLPVVRGTLTGLRSVPAATLEAGRGLGYTPWQLFTRIEVPLAAPLMLEGIRLAGVSLMGLAALSSLIGAGGLGAFIFTGLGSGALDRVMLGAIPTLILALIANALLRQLEITAIPRGLR